MATARHPHHKLIFLPGARAVVKFASIQEKKRASIVVVLDNLHEGVLLADIYDPTLNPLYQHLLAHYGVVAMACRVRDRLSVRRGSSGSCY
jgi:MinD-like ATPase involved in chromosome partitioning or flagellar assembly